MLPEFFLSDIEPINWWSWVILALRVVVDEQICVPVKAVLGDGFSEDFFDPFWHICVILGLRQENATSILEDGILSAPKHHSEIWMWLADDSPWFCLIQSWIQVNVDTWLLWVNGNCWDNADQLWVLFECVHPGNVVYCSVLGAVEVVPVVLTWEIVVVRVKSLGHPP